MNARETFSSGEIIGILCELAVRVSIVAAEDFGIDAAGLVLECQQGEIEFECLLVGTEPHFGAVLLRASQFCAADDALEVANIFNSMNGSAGTCVHVDDAGDVVIDGDGESLVVTRHSIFFGGGITVANLRLHVALWLEVLYDIFGVEEQNNESDPGPLLGPKVREMGTVEQIEWILGTDLVPRTAKELATFLMIDKQIINRELYLQTRIFNRDECQPPRWILRNRD